ncbi:hypothetical protein JCM8097_003162, partial [Rhodosporidiobolus ruineniae]
PEPQLCPDHIKCYLHFSLLSIFDALHLSYSCSTRPSFWMHTLSWPSGGEIDIFKGVNLWLMNQLAVYSDAVGYANTTSLTQTGKLTKFSSPDRSTWSLLDAYYTESSCAINQI